MNQLSNLNRKDLRSFGILIGVFFVIIFGIFSPWIRTHSFPKWPWILASIFWSLAILSPNTLRPIYKVWMRIGLVLGNINTSVILGIVFYGLMFPMGILMRLFRSDPLSREFSSNLQTYRLPCSCKLLTSMEKPY